MADASKSLLVVGVPSDVFARFPPMLWRTSFDVTSPSSPPLAMTAIATSSYALVITGFPLEGLPFERFLDELRAFGGPCRRTGLLAVAAPDKVAEASRYLGRGLNRVVSGEARDDAIAAVISELLEVAPRAAIRADITMRTSIRDRERAFLTQTVNISRSGMLVRLHGMLEVGDRFTFRLDMPALNHPVSGTGQVARVTDPHRERLSGTGVRFLGFDSDGEERLRTFLETAVVK